MTSKQKKSIIGRMIDFFRKWKLVSSIRKTSIKMDRIEVEEETGVRFGIPRKLFLGAMAEEYLYGIPHKIYGKSWKLKRMTKDLNLLRDLEEENPKIIKLKTILERDNEAFNRFGITTERPKTPLSKINNSEKFVEIIKNTIEQNRVTIELTGKGYTYGNISNTIERFIKEFRGIWSIVVIISGSIWVSPFLVEIKEFIISFFK